MTTYSIPPTVLYILQHSVTGLKYFGKTTQDIRKYKGSGIHWLRHCKKHPGKIKTIWVSEPYTNAEIVSKFALSFSRDNNIVESKEWANLIAENGLGGGTPGTLSIESRNKMSDAGKNRPPISAETRQKLSAAGKGKTHSAESKQKMSDAKKGKPHSAEHRKKLSDAARGKTHSDETKQKMSDAWKTRPPMSDETKQKISVYQKGRSRKPSDQE